MRSIGGPCGDIHLGLFKNINESALNVDNIIYSEWQDHQYSSLRS